MSEKALDDLQHDHSHLSRLVFEVRELVATWSKAPLDATARASLADGVDALLDDLATHFAREEEGLFPFVTQRAPELGARVARLSTLHDALCGGLARLSRTLGSEGAPQGVIVAFDRFEEAYAEHSREERELLELLRVDLDADERVTLHGLLAGL